MSTDNRPKITTSQVIALLDEGKNREEIREHFGLTPGDLKKLFSNPQLKGKKTRKAPGFIFEDDSVPAVETAAPEVAADNTTVNSFDTLVEEDERTADQIEDDAQQEADREDIAAHEADEETASNWNN